MECCVNVNGSISFFRLFHEADTYIKQSTILYSKSAKYTAAAAAIRLLFHNFSSAKGEANGQTEIFLEYNNFCWESNEHELWNACVFYEWNGAEWNEISLLSFTIARVIILRSNS